MVLRWFAADKLLALILLFAFAFTSLPRVMAQLPAIVSRPVEGWKVDKTWSMPPAQVDQISRKWQVKILSVENTVVSIAEKPIQINTIVCPDRATAEQAVAELRKGKPNPRMVCRSGSHVYEFVARTSRDAKLAMMAREQFRISPAEATYKVKFNAIPIAGGEWMRANEFFNELLRNEQDTQRLRDLATSFEPADSLSLRKYGQGDQLSRWTIKDVAPRAGMKCVEVSGTVTSQRNGKTPQSDEDSVQVLPATAWPSDDPEIQVLAKRITTAATTTQAKVNAIVRWIHSSEGIRFGGNVTGSRYGTKQVIEQHYGHCWDFADVFITLCRASELPSRQVFGWIDGSEGHVWAEVLVDGVWHSVDPTENFPCGSDYVPLATSNDGVMPMIYASRPILIRSDDADRP